MAKSSTEIIESFGSLNKKSYSIVDEKNAPLLQQFPSSTSDVEEAIIQDSKDETLYPITVDMPSQQPDMSVTAPIFEERHHQSGSTKPRPRVKVTLTPEEIKPRKIPFVVKFIGCALLLFAALSLLNANVKCITGKNVFVRDEASISTAKLGIVNKGDCFFVKKAENNNEYLQITSGKYKGEWISVINTKGIFFGNQDKIK
jgi:hypothetical protein